jgi:hypothetical protein
LDKECAVKSASAEPAERSGAAAAATPGAGRAERVLREELARANRALDGVAPVLGHVLASSGHALVSDAIVARLRGMLNDIARQLVEGLDVSLIAMDGPAAADPVDALSGQLAGDAPLLTYLHALALEGILTEQLDQRAGIDPVLSPLWQELIASADASTGEKAMQALAAQSRFMQAQRRMQLRLLELPAETLERVLRIWVRSVPLEHEPTVTEAMRALKNEYDEAQTRVGLIARLTAGMRGGSIAALELDHAGLALFASALAQLSGQRRIEAVLACHERQAARLALSLRAAGLEPSAIERQFLILEPSERVPTGLGDLAPDAARAMLHGAGRDGADAAERAPR